MRPSKIRVAKYGHSATSKWVVEGLKNNKGRRSRKFFHTKAEADFFARDAHAQQTQLGCSSVTLPFELRLSAISCAEKLKPFGKTLEDATDALIKSLKTTPVDLCSNSLVNEYLEIKRSKGLSTSHIHDITNRFKIFVASFDSRSLAEITTADIEAWLQKYEGQNHNNYLQRLTSLFNYAVKRGYLASNPVNAIEKVKVRDKEVEILTVEQTAQFLGSLPERAMPFFAIGAFAGLRPREIERLDWSDVQLNEGFIRVRAKIAKTASNRLVDIQPNLKSWLSRLEKTSGPVTPLNLRRIRSATQQKIGLKRWPQDGLRHSYASYHLAHFRNINELATQMGHTDTKLIFRHYRSVVSKDEAAKFWKIEPAELA